MVTSSTSSDTLRSFLCFFGWFLRRDRLLSGIGGQTEAYEVNHYAYLHKICWCDHACLWDIFDDLAANICKTKALTNMRSATKGITTGITAPIELSLDASVEYIASDEILEVTPSTFRMAKNPDLLKKGGKK